MLKLRITYEDETPEIEEALLLLENIFKIKNQSKPYPLRGNSTYANIYLDIEIPTKGDILHGIK